MDAAEAVQQQLAGFFPGLLGVRVESATPECVAAELEIRDDLCTLPGVAHGGALMALADTLGAIGTVLNLPPGASTTTLESKTNFVAVGRGGTTVRGEAKPLKIGRRVMIWETRISDAEGKLLAVVTQTQMVLEARREPAEVMASLFEGKTPEAQKALLAVLERAGASFYRLLAEAEPDGRKAEDLLAAAEREEKNARLLEDAASED